MAEKLSKSDLKEIFDDICKWVRKQGCKVMCRWQSPTVMGSNGYFTPDPDPQILMGLKGRDLDKAIVLLLHEFSHYWQWAEKFLDRKDDKGNETYGLILDGHKVAPKDRDAAKELVSVSEYDCEKRTGHLLKMWNLEMVRPAQEHIKYANSYNRHAAWSIGTGKNPGSGVFYPHHEQMAEILWPTKKKHTWFTREQLLAPISADHKRKFDEAYASFKRKNKNKKVRRLC